MRILLANDDGIDAKGIAALVNILKKDHEVYVAAPHRQRSGYSHSITYFIRHRRAWRREIEGTAGAWAIDATPADCVYYGCFAFLKQMPDLIITGINQGENLSSDCIYSGTVGAASEGMIIGIPSIAVSLCSYTSENYEAAAKAVQQVIPYYMKDPQRLEYLLNINVPSLPYEELKGFRITQIEGSRSYEKPVDVVDQEDGSLLLVCDHVPMTSKHLLNTLSGDVTAVRNGYVSITPLDNETTNFDQIDNMKEYENIPF